MPEWRGFTTDGGMFLIPLALLVLLVPVHGSWAAQLLLILLLLTVPGVILLRAMRVPGSVIVSFPVYVPCASLVVLLGSGLVVDLVGPAAGFSAPLRPWPLLVGLEFICLILLAVSTNAPPSVAIPWRDLPPPVRTTLPLLLPLVAAAGALRLNSDNGNSIALIALCVCGLAAAALVVYAGKLETSLVAVSLYAIGLTMLWSYSLRGVSVYGFDISHEYYILQRTVASGVWHPAHPGDAFAAMLSTSVFPAELHAIAGVSELSVFKIVYPLISALFPVAVFSLACRVLAPRWAFSAGALIITQSPTFGQELPGIARQQIALVLFTALVAAMLETKLPRHHQWALVISYALAMVVSHYTTTYVTITLLGLALFLQRVISWFRPDVRVSGAMFVAFIASIIGAAIWYGPITHSSSNVIQFARVTQSQGLDLLPNRAQAGGLIASYLEGNTVTPISAGKYAHLVYSEYAKTDPFVHPLPDASNPAFQLLNSATPSPPIRWRLGYNALGFGDVIAQQLIYLLAAVGTLIMVFGRRVSVLARQIGLLTVATLVFLAAIRFSGTLASFYNADRALLQAMVFLNIPLFWCIEAWVGRRRLRQVCAVIAGAAWIALLFAVGNGVVGAALGGGTATSLANSGSDFEQFYVTAPELASATWLGAQVQPGQLVYTDEYGQLPLVSMTGISSGLFLDVTPETLNSHAWVYASSANVIDGRARASFQGHSVSYVFPSKFLNANYNLVYTNGSSKVYQR